MEDARTYSPTKMNYDLIGAYLLSYYPKEGFLIDFDSNPLYLLSDQLLLLTYFFFDLFFKEFLSFHFCLFFFRDFLIFLRLA